MKVLKTVAAVALVLVVSVGLVQAQQYSIAKTGIKVAASGTSNDVATVVCTKHEDVAIHLKWTLAGSGTDNTVVSYSKSLDGVLYETTPSVVFTVANTGTTAVNVTTNVTMGAVGYLKLASIVNGDTGDVLTLTNTFALKPQRFGK
jgi:hypothetical protein